MKRFGKLALVSVLLIVLLSSCMSTRTGHVGMYPMRYIPINSVEELQADGFTILGTVSGSGNVSEKDAGDGDTLRYGTQEILEGDRMYFDIDEYYMDDPYFVSLSNAIAELIDEAKEVGASFVTFPNYTIEVVDGRVITEITAVAVALTEPISESNSSQPIRVEVVLPDSEK